MNSRGTIEQRTLPSAKSFQERCIRALSALAACTALTLAAAAPAPAEETAAEPAANPAEEAFVATHKCATCHSVQSAGIEATSEKMKSTDLGGYTTDDVPGLGRFLRREEERDAAKHKKPYKGSDEELQAIVDWLSGLEAAEAAP